MNKVIIYTTPICVYCKMTKSFFKQYKVEYEEKDVSFSDKDRTEMIDKSGQLAVPVIDINGAIVVGFDKQRLMALLGIEQVN